MNTNQNTHRSKLETEAREWLHKRGVTMQDMAELVYHLQAKYHDNLTMEECISNVDKVLGKREVQHAIMTGIQLDVLAEKQQLDSRLQETIAADEWLYGIEEVVVLCIVNVYGSIGFTNFVYIETIKPGILKELNEPKPGVVHTCHVDIVGAIAAEASRRLDHSQAEDILV